MLPLIQKASNEGQDDANYSFVIISICLDGVYKEQEIMIIGEKRVIKEQKEITRQYRY